MHATASFRNLRIVLFCLFAASPCAAADRGLAGIVADGKWVRERDLDEIGQYHALVIGIDEYQDPNWELRCAANDARAVAQVLRDDYGFKVVEVYDKDATLDRIREELGKLGDVLKEKDSLLIYYAGHGALERKTGYWIPADAKPGRRWTYLENVVIRNFLRIEQIRARHVLLVSDSCYAGALLRRGEPAEMKLPAHVGDALSTPSRECLTSGGEKPVADGLPGGHSVFARYFLKALKNPPRSAFLPTEIVPKLVENVRRNSPQQPVLGRLRDCGDEVGGEFVFFYRRSTAQTARTFKLTLRSEPGDARVLLNDQPEGVTPFTSELEIGREYRIVLAKTDHADWERRLVWPKPEPLELVARLRPAGGRDTRLQIALDYLKQGDLAVGQRLLQDVAKGDSADAIRALTELFGMEMKQPRTAKAREWADELRRRFPASAESNEADKGLYERGMAGVAAGDDVEAIRTRIAALDRFKREDPKNAFVAKAEAEDQRLREGLLGLHRAAASQLDKVARDFVKVDNFQAAGEAADKLKRLRSEAQQIDGLTLDGRMLSRLTKDLHDAERAFLDGKSFRDARGVAMAAERSKDYARAIAAYEDLLRREANHRHAAQVRLEVARLRDAKVKSDKEQHQLAIERAFDNARDAAKAAESRHDYAAGIAAYQAFLRSEGESQRAEEARREATRLRDAKQKYEGAQYAAALSSAQAALSRRDSDSVAKHCEVALRYRPNDAEAQRLLEQVKPFLVVTSQPTGAQVLLDGRPIGTTSGGGLRHSDVERNRSYRVEVRLKGHYAPSQEVRLAKFGRLPLHFDLKESALPPGWEQAFVVPTGDRDQHGNPVVTRNGSRTDVRTGMPYEVWLETTVTRVTSGWLFTKATKPVRLEFVLVPVGQFMMGSPSGENYRSDDERQHQVRLTKPFYLAKYELTQAQYEAVAGKNPSRFKGARNPVEQVSWDDAVKFCERLSSQAGGGLQLPTEAQWEYACRAGSTTAYCFGDSDSQLGGHAWHGSNSGRKTHPVGQKSPNAWGLYDLHGNVWEWCQDWYGDYPSGGVTDPTGAPRGSYRVDRGGGFIGGADDCRSAFRGGYVPGIRRSILGFRPSRSLP